MKPNIPVHGEKNENYSGLHGNNHETSFSAHNNHVYNSDNKKIYILLAIIFVLLFGLIICVTIYIVSDKNKDENVVSYETSYFEKGDVNGDGFIDSLDASLILAYYSYKSTNGTMSFEEFIESQ